MTNLNGMFPSVQQSDDSSNSEHLLEWRIKSDQMEGSLDDESASEKPRKPLTVGFRTGRWSLDEKILFLHGLRKFGKGRWKKMSVYLPNRSLVQIKSHAQKVLKRMDSGENVFRRLEENADRLEQLLEKLEDSDHPIRPLPPATAKRVRRSKKGAAEDVQIEGTEHLIAANALCQLSAPSTTRDWNHPKPAFDFQPEASTSDMKKIVIGSSWISP